VSLRQIPNLICAARVVLIVPIVWTLLHGQSAWTLLLFGIAAVSDGADGFLAKKFGWQTRLGAFLDPAADKALLITVFITLAVMGLAPLWLVAIVVGRDVVIVSGALAYRLRFGALEMHPRIASKINTGCQLAFVLGIVCSQAFSLPKDWVITALGAAVLVMGVISGLDYVLTYAFKAMQAARAEGSSPGAGGVSSN
jgi:cardiolipin synthase (CMP-forming)